MENGAKRNNLREKKWIDFAILYFIRPKTLNFILFILVAFVIRELTVLGLDENSVIKLSDHLRNSYPNSQLSEIIAIILEALFTKGNANILIISLLLTSIIALLKLTDINKQINNNFKIFSFIGLVSFTIAFVWYNFIRIGNVDNEINITFEITDSHNLDSTSDVLFIKEERNFFLPMGVLNKLDYIGSYRRFNGTEVPLNSYDINSKGYLKIGEIESSLTVEFNVNEDKFQLKLNKDGVNYDLISIENFTIETYNIKGEILDLLPDELVLVKGQEDSFKSGIRKIIESIDSMQGYKWSDSQFNEIWLRQTVNIIKSLESKVENFDFMSYFFKLKDECKFLSGQEVDSYCLKRIFEKIETKINSH